MNPTEHPFNALRQRLERRADELRDEIAQARPSNTVDATPETLDQKDLADVRAQNVVVDAEADRDRVELAAVLSALDRLAQGTYGLCADCGEPIDAQRLMAEPSALRCLGCQAQQETASRQHHLGR